MQFMFTYIRKPVRLTWVWQIFALTGRRVSTQPGKGSDSELDRASFLHAPAIQLTRGGLLGGPQGLSLPDHSWGTETPSWEKWGSRWVLPISLCWPQLSGTSRGFHPGSKGRGGVAQPPTPQLLPEQTQCFANSSRQLFLPVLYNRNSQRQWF